MSEHKQKIVPVPGYAWEGPVEILHDVVEIFPKYNKPCKHAQPASGEEFIIPRVLQNYNEGGCCSTGVCLDCVLDVVNSEEYKNDIGRLNKRNE